MGFLNLIDKEKKFTILDVGLDEIAMIAFAFLVAKYFPQVTALDWYWYVIVFTLAIIKPVKALFEE